MATCTGAAWVCTRWGTRAGRSKQMSPSPEAISNFLEFANENLIFSNRVWLQKRLLKTGCMPSSRWPMQYKLNSIFGDSLFHVVSGQYFLTLQENLCVYIVASSLCVYRVSVCFCVCVSHAFSLVLLQACFGLFWFVCICFILS